MTTGHRTIKGAIKKKTFFLVFGAQSSFKSSFIASAKVCKIPSYPTRFGPNLSVNSARMRLSRYTRSKTIIVANIIVIMKQISGYAAAIIV